MVDHTFKIKKIIEVKSKITIKRSIVKSTQKSRNYHSFINLYSLLSLLREVNKDFDNIMYYLFEQSKRGIDVYSKMISDKFGYPKSKVGRFIKRAFNRGFIDKITKCKNCGKEYRRVPEVCIIQKCKSSFIRQQGLNNNGKKYPYYIIKLTDEGKKYVELRLDNFYEIFGIFRKRIKNLG